MQMTLLLTVFVLFVFLCLFVLTEQLERWELPLTDIAKTGTLFLRGGREFSFGQVTLEMLIRR